MIFLVVLMVPHLIQTDVKFDVGRTVRDLSIRAFLAHRDRSSRCLRKQLQAVNHSDTCGASKQSSNGSPRKLPTSAYQLLPRRGMIARVYRKHSANEVSEFRHRQDVRGRKGSLDDMYKSGNARLNLAIKSNECSHHQRWKKLEVPFW